MTNSVWDDMSYSKEWYQKHNPQGMTISKASEIMKPWMDTGLTLEQAINSNNMNSNRVQFDVPFNALIDDTKQEKATEEVITKNTDTTNTTNTTNKIDLDKWWEGVDKPWLNKDTKSEGMDDFMKFMMFMSMMRPQGGRSGSQYGYGGLNPGGVVNSYNPLSNIDKLVSAFGSIPGVGSGDVKIGTPLAGDDDPEKFPPGLKFPFAFKQMGLTF